MTPRNPIESQLRWRCQRGMLELDIILQKFFDQRYRSLSKTDQATFTELLTYEDSELFLWFLQRAYPEEAALKSLVHTILTFHEQP